jgi:hypothetical protein
MFAVNANLQKVSFVRESPTRPIITINGDIPVTWNTEPMQCLLDEHVALYSRRCDCALACDECWCAKEGKKLWML